MSRIRRKLDRWVESAKRNERRWMAAEDLKWIADTSPDVDDLIGRVKQWLEKWS